MYCYLYKYLVEGNLKAVYQARKRPLMMSDFRGGGSKMTPKYGTLEGKNDQCPMAFGEI